MAESITLQTSDSNIQFSDVLGRLSFAASNESSFSDARLIGASIYAAAESDFTEISNATSLIFATASSENAQEVARINSDGYLGINITNPIYHLHVNGTIFGTSILENGKPVIISDITSVSGSDIVSNIISLTQSEYDAITPSSGTFYIISDAVSNYVNGSGISNYIAKWNNSNVLTSGLIFDNNTNIGIGTNQPAAPLHLVGPRHANFGSFLIQDSTNFAQNVGGSIVFGGKYNSAEEYARYGQVAALKANSTDGNTQAVLSFSTNDGSVFAERMRILPSGNVAFGSTGSDFHRFSIRGNINQNNAIGIFSDTAYGSAAASGTIFNNYSRGQINAYTLQNHYHFFTAVPVLTNGATVNNELCYTASHSSSGVVSQRGFYSTIAGTGSWQLYMGGSAPNYIEGNVGIGILNPTNKLQVEGGNVVFNDTGGNFDFRVEGDTDNALLFVDASTDSVGIGISDPLSTLHIEKNGVTSLRLQRSAAVGTSTVPVERSHIVFPNYNNVYDQVKLISWGRESNFLAGMLGVNISNSSGVSSEVLTIDNQSTANTFGLRTYNIPLVTTSGNVIFNETAGNFDFRAEGVSDPNLLFVDASADRVGIGTSSPSHKLDVLGTGNFSYVLSSGCPAIISNTGIASGSDQILNIVSLTQAEYDAATKNNQTLYIITS